VVGEPDVSRVSGRCDRYFAAQRYCYMDQRRDDRAVRQRIEEIAATRVRYGFERSRILLRREGWRDNHKIIGRGGRVLLLSAILLEKHKPQGIAVNRNAGWCGDRT
jgi:transposase InsO family protein